MYYMLIIYVNLNSNFNNKEIYYIKKHIKNIKKPYLYIILIKKALLIILKLNKKLKLIQP
jgi:hypothetical protein